MSNESIPEWASEVTKKTLDEASRFVIGKRDILENLLVALLAGGHVLLEGVPGVAKTYIAKTFAKTLGCEFTRIQFTPDLLPIDITGSFIFDQKTSGFKLRKGPIFSNIVLIDEINRGTPKTQSGTIEVMQERQVTIEGHTFPIQEPFMVVATRNRLEVEGVYPLVEAQIDRFMLRLNVDYPTADEEHDLIERLPTIDSFDVNKVTSAERVKELTTYVQKVYVSEEMKIYMEDLVRKTRQTERIRLGGSPRALIHLYKACKARALIAGRDYVTPDDVKHLIAPTLNHRMWLSREAQTEDATVDEVVQQIVRDTPIPGIRVARPDK